MQTPKSPPKHCTAEDQMEGNGIHNTQKWVAHNFPLFTCILCTRPYENGGNQLKLINQAKRIGMHMVRFE